MFLGDEVKEKGAVGHVARMKGAFTVLFGLSDWKDCLEQPYVGCDTEGVFFFSF
jgi:hypothetical protein